MESNKSPKQLLRAKRNSHHVHSISDPIAIKKDGKSVGGHRKGSAFNFNLPNDVIKLPSQSSSGKPGFSPYPS